MQGIFTLVVLVMAWTLLEMNFPQLGLQAQALLGFVGLGFSSGKIYAGKPLYEARALDRSPRCIHSHICDHELGVSPGPDGLGLVEDALERRAYIVAAAKESWDVYK